LIPDEYVWLVWSSAFLVPWALLYWRFPEYRRPMIWASVFTAPFGLIARAFQVSEFIIGLTVIAIGTSLPEIAATIVASLRGEVEIAVGNVIGSNIFNILLVLGLTSAVTPQGLQVTQEALRFDIPLLVAVSFACLPLMANGLRVSRLDGAVLLGITCYMLATFTSTRSITGT